MNTTPYEVKWSESRSVVSNSFQPHRLAHGILQARILEWVAFPFSRGSSHPRDQTGASCIAGRLFTNWATREAHAIQYILIVYLVYVKQCIVSVNPRCNLLIPETEEEQIRSMELTKLLFLSRKHEVIFFF